MCEAFFYSMFFYIQPVRPKHQGTSQQINKHSILFPLTIFISVLAASSIANIVKSSLGPVGLDKMLVDDIGVSIYNIKTKFIFCGILLINNRYLVSWFYLPLFIHFHLNYLVVGPINVFTSFVMSLQMNLVSSFTATLQINIYWNKLLKEVL